MSKRKRKTRNPLHDHPLLRKGGVHEKSHKAKRRGEKQALRRAWLFPSPGAIQSSEKSTPCHA